MILTDFIRIMLIRIMLIGQQKFYQKEFNFKKP